jgi:hypothetical protein
LYLATADFVAVVVRRLFHGCGVSCSLSMLVYSFYYLEEFTGLIVRGYASDMREIFNLPTTISFSVRQVWRQLYSWALILPTGILHCKICARWKTWLIIAVTIPLWSVISCVYAWKLIRPGGSFVVYQPASSGSV